MEENRLRPMKDGHDALFKELFEKTEALRKKLAYEINANRFGLEYKDILSAFNIKFIYTFNRYVDEMPKDRLKGYIINSLRMYKKKIIMNSYQEKFQNNPIQFIESYNLEDDSLLEDPAVTEYRNNLLELTYKFMKLHLSNDAYQVFEIDLNPPPFIIEKMKSLGKENLNKIPPLLVAQYLNLGTSQSAEKYIRELRQQVKGVIEIAKAELNKLT
jgi:hypothetical protein